MKEGRKISEEDGGEWERFKGYITSEAPTKRIQLPDFKN